MGEEQEDEKLGKIDGKEGVRLVYMKVREKTFQKTCRIYTLVWFGCSLILLLHPAKGNSFLESKV